MMPDEQGPDSIAPRQDAVIRPETVHARAYVPQATTRTASGTATLELNATVTITDEVEVRVNPAPDLGAVADRRITTDMIQLVDGAFLMDVSDGRSGWLGGGDNTWDAAMLIALWLDGDEPEVPDH
jgi:hypothetical protein